MAIYILCVNCLCVRNAGYTLSRVRNSFTRNLYWESKMAEKLSALKPWGLRNWSFSFDNFEFGLKRQANLAGILG